MAKTDIVFNNKNYSIDESSLSAATAELRQHLSTVMNGSGAVINLAGTSYNIDSGKLSAATNTFVSHLGTIAGSGSKVIVGGVEYSIGSDKVAGAVSDLETVLGNLNRPSSEGTDHSGIIPQDGVYTAADGTVYNAGEAFPEIATGDIYRYGDYEYCYGYGLSDESEWHESYPVDDWAVRCMNNIAEPDAILESIGGRPVTSMGYAFSWFTSLTTAPKIPSSVTNMESTFAYCKSLTTAPEIPNSVTNMDYAFESCEALVTAPVIPSGVTNMRNTFSRCTNLTGVITINANPTDYSWCFYNTVKPIILVGSSPMLEEIAATANNYNVTAGRAVSGTPELIPEGGVYTAVDGAVYNAGEYTPSTIVTGDIYRYGDYEYCYGYRWCNDCEQWSHICGDRHTTDCWAVRCINDIAEPGAILGNIGGYPVTNMENTFAYCKSLTTAPEIPNSVTDMNLAFYRSSLTTAPEIPSSVTNMRGTFRGCTNLTGTITINANPTDYIACFEDTVKPIILIGSSTMLEEIAATASNGNVTVQ